MLAKFDVETIQQERREESKQECLGEAGGCGNEDWGDLGKYPLIDLWEAQGGRDFPAGSLGA